MADCRLAANKDRATIAGDEVSNVHQLHLRRLLRAGAGDYSDSNVGGGGGGEATSSCRTSNSPMI